MSLSHHDGGGATSSTQHYGAIVTPTFAFGMDLGCRCPVWHLEGDRMLWSVGAQVALVTTATNEMRFIPLGDPGARAMVLAVAANGKYFAAVERVEGQEHEQVSVYSFATEKRVKLLPLPLAATATPAAAAAAATGGPQGGAGGGGSTGGGPGSSRGGTESGTLGGTATCVRVECLHFSENSKFLLTQYAEPDWVLVVWRWYSGKVLASLRLDSRVVCARFSPFDDLLLAVATPTSLGQYRMDVEHDTLKQVAAPPAWDHPHLTASCWLAGNLLAAVGSGGEVYVFQDGAPRLSTRAEPLQCSSSSHSGAASSSGTSPGPGHGGSTASGRTAFLHRHPHRTPGGGTPDGEHPLHPGFPAAGYRPPPGLSAWDPASGADQLLAVAARSRGFLAAGRSGTVYFYDPPGVEQKRQGVRDHYVLTRRLLAEVPGGPGLAGAAGWPLVWLSVAPSDEEVAVVGAGGDVLVARMSLVAEREEKPLGPLVGPEILEGEPFRRLLGGFLTSRVVGLAAASSVPLVAAAGEDRQLRVWHYEARRCVAALQAPDEVLCLDMHPGGQLLAAGMYDKMRMYGIVLDGLELVLEAAIKRCNVVRFSNGGGLLAGVGRANAIVLHATYRGQPQVACLRGHATAVTELAFTADDRMLLSSGLGGAVYFWDLFRFTRLVELEHVDKQCIFAGMVPYNHTPGGAVVRTNDGRVLQVLNGKVEYEVRCKGGQHAPACLLGDDRVYLCADDRGCLQSHAWPHDFPVRPGYQALVPPPTPYPLHAAAGGAGGITRMALVPERGLLFTASGDGVVLMSSVALVINGVLLESARAVAAREGGGQGGEALGPGGAAGGGGGLAPYHYYVTVPEERLSALRERVVEVARLVGSARSEAEYQAFRAAQVLRDAITRLEGELAAARAALAERDRAIAQLQEEGRHLERKVIKELEGAHMSAAEELELLYDKRLQIEADKYRVLAAARDDAHYRHEEAVRRLREAHAQNIEELQANHASEVAALRHELAAAAEARGEQDRFFNEYVKQAEDDFEDHAERVNDKLTVMAEAAEAREARLKADNNILKRTNLRLKADKTMDLKRVDKLTADNTLLREQAEELSLTITKLQRELHERDAVNADNYATIQQLRRKVQDLEKHKFVLSYKAETYAKALEPQQQEVARLQTEAEGYDRELLGNMRRLQELQRHMAEKDTALRTIKTELSALQDRASRQENIISNFSHDLYSAMQQPDDRGARGKSPRQRALDELLKRYCHGAHGMDVAVAAGRDAAQQMAAQAAAAETRVVLLQWRAEQERRAARQAQGATLHQNSQLLRELQVVQQDYRALRDRFDGAMLALRELQRRYRQAERRAGGAAGAGEGEGEDDGQDCGSGEEAAGPPPPSLPVGLAGGSGTGRPFSAAAGRGCAAGSGYRAARPSTASAARPASSSGSWGGYRTAGTGAAVNGGVGAGGAAGVVRGSADRAAAEVVGGEQQRLRELAAGLSEGAAAAELQQRAVDGLREQLAAAAARADAGEGEWEEGEGLGVAPGLGGHLRQAGPGGFSAVMEGVEEDDGGDGDGPWGAAGRTGLVSHSDTAGVVGSALSGQWAAIVSRGGVGEAVVPGGTIRFASGGRTATTARPATASPASASARRAAASASAVSRSVSAAPGPLGTRQRPGTATVRSGGGLSSSYSAGTGHGGGGMAHLLAAAGGQRRRPSTAAGMGVRAVADGPFRSGLATALQPPAGGGAGRLEGDAHGSAQYGLTLL